MLSREKEGIYKNGTEELHASTAGRAQGVVISKSAAQSTEILREQYLKSAAIDRLCRV